MKTPPHAHLEKILAKTRRRIIGLMSGMSMDGVDLALVTISGDFPQLSITLEDSFFRPYGGGLKGELERLRSGGSTAAVSEYNFRVAREFAATVNDFLAARNIDPDSVDAIGSHGQTIYHDSGNPDCASTLQIGSGGVIAQLTGILTISNFRERDLAAGGTGAPLVPLVDFLLFRRDGEYLALNNLGSISNLTIVTPDLNDLLAFDTGPANMPIDFAAKLIPGNTDGIDRDGQFSSRGKVHRPLLEALLKNPFFQKAPPKAAGYNEFGPAQLEATVRAIGTIDPLDLVTTMVEFSAQTIAGAYERFVLPSYPALKKLIFTGGGAKNPNLISRVEALLPQLVVESLDSSDRRFSDAKEALAFAVLANETLSGRFGNVPQVTGARTGVILGDISI